MMHLRSSTTRLRLRLPTATATAASTQQLHLNNNNKNSNILKRYLLTGETKTWVTTSSYNNYSNKNIADPSSTSSTAIFKIEQEEENQKLDLVNYNGAWGPAPRYHLDAAKFAHETSNIEPMQLWRSKFQRLVQFYNTVGYVRSEIEIARKDPVLMHWIVRQRFLYRKEMKLREGGEVEGTGEKVSYVFMAQEKIDLMNSVHFQWSLMQDGESKRKFTHKNQWIEQFQELEKFKSTYGHCNPPYATHEALRQWLHRQRSALLTIDNKGKKKISLDEIQLLDTLGVDWGHRGDIVKKLKLDRHIRLSSNDVKNNGKQKSNSKRQHFSANNNVSAESSKGKSMEVLDPNQPLTLQEDSERGSACIDPRPKHRPTVHTHQSKNLFRKQKSNESSFTRKSASNVEENQRRGVVVIYNRENRNFNQTQTRSEKKGIAFKRKGVHV